MLGNGVPSEPTLCRVENGIDNTLMAKAMERFADSFRRELASGSLPDIICMDGKATRGTVQENGRNPDIVSAFSCGAGITLATEPVRRRAMRSRRCPS